MVLLSVLWAFALMSSFRTVNSFTPIPPLRRCKDFSLLMAVAEVETEANPRLEGLALMLDDGTRKSHSVAQNSAFVTGFFRGLSTKEAYRNLLTSLYFVYTAMEESFDRTTDQRVTTLDDPELRRLSALKEDMDYFYGSNWSETIRASPSTKAYVDRIVQVAESKPYLLIGHQYSRYLGDLFGGQMMGGMAQRSLGLEDNKGVAFYQFEDIPSTKDFITKWYEKLNQLELSDEERMEIVEEANYVFSLNIAILDELEGSPFQAMWSLAWRSMKIRLGL